MHRYVFSYTFIAGSFIYYMAGSSYDINKGRIYKKMCKVLQLKVPRDATCLVAKVFDDD